MNNSPVQKTDWFPGKCDKPVHFRWVQIIGINAPYLDEFSCSNFLKAFFQAKAIRPSGYILLNSSQILEHLIAHTKSPFVSINITYQLFECIEYNKFIHGTGEHWAISTLKIIISDEMQLWELPVDFKVAKSFYCS